MNKATLICQRQFNEHLVEGRLTLLSDKLHFEAHFPNKQRFSLALHSILGLNIQESVCLLLLTQTGIVRFFVPINEDVSIVQDFAKKIREQQHLTEKSFPISSHFEFFLELQMGTVWSQTACSVVLKSGYLLVYSEKETKQEVLLEDIQKYSLTWMGLVTLKTSKTQISFLGPTVSHLYTLIDIDQKFGEREYIRTWSDHYAASFRLSLNCFVVQTEHHIHIYPTIFWLQIGVKPVHIPINSIHELEFQKTYLTILAKDHSFSLTGISNIGFYRKICEHIAKSCSFFFRGPWSEIQEKLPKYDIPTENVIVTAASLWRNDRHILGDRVIIQPLQ